MLYGERGERGEHHHAAQVTEQRVDRIGIGLELKPSALSLGPNESRFA